MKLPRALLAGLAVKVPAVTAAFWTAKVLTTGMGEAASDWLAHWDAPLAVALSGIGLLVALWFAVTADRYVAWRYWLAVVMVSTFGTLAADAVHVVLDIPYEVSAAFFAVLLAATLASWHRIENSLSVHSIRTRRRELFYWSTVLLTFALGTAVGDMTAKNLDLGYLVSGIVFAVLFALALLGRRALGPAGSFWAAYVVTRPFGASFADWLGKAPADGGLGIGDGVVTVAATALVVAFVLLTSRRTA